jgi:hypothetical protein
MKKIIAVLLLVIATKSISDPWPIIFESADGSLNSQCAASEVNELVYYSAQTCEVRFYDVNAINPGENTPYNNYLDMGACGNQITKYILDGKMYKTTYNLHLYAPIPPFAPEPELYIENVGVKMKNCQSALPTSPATTYPMMLILAEDFKMFVLKSLKMGTDEFNKPVVIMETTNGDVSCDGYSKEVVMIDINEDVIFANGFD